jgi:hypothetical protein
MQNVYNIEKKNDDDLTSRNTTFERIAVLERWASRLQHKKSARKENQNRRQAIDGSRTGFDFQFYL